MSLFESGGDAAAAVTTNAATNKRDSLGTVGLRSRRCANGGRPGLDGAAPSQAPGSPRGWKAAAPVRLALRVRVQQASR